ncbi:MAG: aspartate racemase [Marinilabiliales bacterium]|nr:MAG: aspartate racemase [Marinilabiliales bacterium]
MKTIGIIGGMSWESTKLYYEFINEKIKSDLGGFHSCKCLINSVDFAEIQKLQSEDAWDALDIIMSEAAMSLEKGGAEFIILATNTMHLCVDAIIKSINIPFLHIAEATAMAIKTKELKKVALLGTKFTMEKDFYKKILSNNDIEVIIPNEEDRNIIHNTIFGELVKGIFNNTSIDKFKKIIKRLEAEGAQGITLGCTELPLLISQKDVDIEVFDTSRIHAEKAVEMALREI